MPNLLIAILTLAIICGQLIRIPFGNGAIILLDIVSSGIVILGFYKLKFKLFNPPHFIKIAFIFILITLVSLIFTPLNLTNPEFINSFSYIVRFTIYVLLGYIFLSGVFKYGKNKIYLSLLISGIIFSIIGLLQFIILPDLQFLTSGGWDPHYFRNVSTFLDPNFAGAYLTLTLILITQNNSLKRKWKMAIFLLVFISLMATFSRSSYLMFLISGIVLSIIKKSRKILISTVLLFFVLLFSFQLYGYSIAQPRNISREQSASFRLSTWQQGLTLFWEFPILGVGFNAYRYAIRDFNLGDKQFIESHGSSSNDSSLLYVSATTGIIGLCIYLYFIFSILKFSFTQNPILFSAVGGLLVHSIFSNSLFYPPILAWLMLISASPKK